jgi:hypothetical protein
MSQIIIAIAAVLTLLTATMPSTPVGTSATVMDVIPPVG